MFNATAIGRLVKNPVLERTPNNKPVCKFRLATDKPRGKTGANYIDVTVWLGAEQNATHLKAGRQVAVTGNIDHQQWKDDAGEYHERYVLIANEVTWLAKSRAEQDTPADTEEAA